MFFQSTTLILLEFVIALFFLIWFSKKMCMLNLLSSWISTCQWTIIYVHANMTLDFSIA